MIKIVDMRCESCSEIFTDMVFEENLKCETCGGNLKRLFGFRKFKEYPEGYYENLDEGDGPVYIKDRAHFYKECKKRGLEPVVPKAAIERKKRRKVFI